MTRAELHERLWPGALAADFDNSLNAAVKRLREVLGDRADAPRLVETLPRRGYRFVAPLEAGRSAPRRRRRTRAAALAATLGLGVALAALGPPRDVPEAAGPAARLVVLPLAGPEGDAGALADGLTEELTATLAALSPDRLSVLASTSARAIHDAGAGVREIRRRLAATHVLEGGVRTQADRIRVSLRLVDTATEVPLWAWSDDLRDPGGLDLQEAVAARVADALELSLPALRPRLAAGATVSPSSIEDYWTARRALRYPPSAARVAQAETALDRALARDPDFAAGHAALAELQLLRLQASGSADDAARAERAARAAIRLDPEAGGPYAVLALARLHRWDLEGAWRAAERGLALDAGQAVQQHAAALVRSASGEDESAVAAARRAVALDPLSWTVDGDLAWTYYYARRFGDAIAHERSSREKWPAGSPLPWVVPLSLQLAGRGDEAVERLRLDLAARGIADESRRRFDRAAEAGSLGVAGWARDVFLRQAETGPANTQMLVRLHALRAENEAALDWLERAADAREGWLVWAALDPALDGLRSEPRYERVVRRVRDGA